MPANALQVLDRLGVADEVGRAGVALRKGEIRDVRVGILQAIHLEFVERSYGFGMIALNRARLQRILAERLPPEAIHLGKPFVDVSSSDGGITVRLADGTDVRSDLVVGADGLRSTVRGRLFPEAGIRYSGQTSFRGIARHPLPDSLHATAWEVWSSGCRFGFAPIAHDETYWFAVQDAPSGRSDPEGTVLSRLTARFADFPRPIPELLGHTREEGVLRTDISDLRPMSTWSRGRVTLLGDAAHATTPNLGQGGAQAIEDAWVLADRLAANGDAHATAFGEYERIRKPKADRIVRASWWFGRLAHVGNPIGRALRNAALGAMPASAQERQLRMIYALNY